MAAKKPTEPSSDKQAARAIAERFDLKRVRMTACDARSTIEDNELPQKTTINVQVKVRLGTSVNSPSTSIIIVDAQFRLLSSYTDRPTVDAAPPLAVSSQFQLIYESSEQVDATTIDLEAFGHYTALFNVWPFWREFVQSTVVRMGLPPLTVPLFKPAFVQEMLSQKRRRKKPAKRKRD